MPNGDAIDGILPKIKTNGECHTNGLRNYHHTNMTKIEENGNHILINGDDDINDDDNSYRALDQLLASLALENDIMEQHLSQINNNNGRGGVSGGRDSSVKPKHLNQTTNSVFSFDTTNNMREYHHFATNGDGYRSAAQTNGGVFDESLNDVLANLMEFTENEMLPPQTNSITTNHHHHHHHHMANGIHNNYSHNHFHHNNHVDSNYITSTNGNSNNNNTTITNTHNHNNHIGRIVHNYHEPSNNAIKRLTSESENSSSVSPSLSERSNGIVSWSDQVCCAL